MHSKAKGPTKAEKKRLEALLELGCVCCRMDGRPKYRKAEVHHLLDGGVRIGHAATIGLCAWHHRGVPDYAGLGWSERVLGPSLVAHASSKNSGSKNFHRHYGSDQDILDYTNSLLSFAGHKT